MLEIRNLQTNEITALETCNLSRERIAVQLNGAGKARIVTISKAEITSYQLFLKFFGLGKLANTKLDLKSVANYLNSYNWKKVTDFNKHPQQYRAYLNVCALANKALARNGCADLFENVSKLDQAVPVFTDGTYRGNRTISWNPCLTFGDIKGFLERYSNYPNQQIGIGKSRETLTFPTATAIVKEKDLKNLKIFRGNIPTFTNFDISFQRSVRIA